MAELSTKESAPQASPKPWWEERLTTYVAVTAVILAVCATLATFKAAGYGNRMVMSQSQASDQWAYYQAKSIKETQYQVQRDVIALVSQQMGTNPAVQERLDAYQKEVSRYKQEKDEIMQEAKRLESLRDISQDLSSEIGKAIILLQIGILLTSLAAINKTAYFWFMGMGSGGVGIIMFVLAMLKTV